MQRAGALALRRGGSFTTRPGPPIPLNLESPPAARRCLVSVGRMLVALGVVGVAATATSASWRPRRTPLLKCVSARHLPREAEFSLSFTHHTTTHCRNSRLLQQERSLVQQALFAKMRTQRGKAPGLRRRLAACWPAQARVARPCWMGDACFLARRTATMLRPRSTSEG